MPRLRSLRDEELPEKYRPAPGSATSDVVRVFAHNPAYFDRWNDFYRPLMRDGSVPMRLKEMMRLRVAQLNECVV